MHAIARTVQVATQLIARFGHDAIPRVPCMDCKTLNLHNKGETSRAAAGSRLLFAVRLLQGLLHSRCALLPLLSTGRVSLHFSRQIKGLQHQSRSTSATQ